ncbi:MAG: PTS sugar transporter subunit IIB [Gemmatimonadota bacterium]|nr:PTS sugar transporter subunit IIB [Gemmatimonadota bacterium]
MGVELYRVDDRLIHGQVVVGWGQPMSLGFIALVDDEVANSDWEQELYRMAVPPDMDVFFEPVAGVAGRLARWRADERPGILLTGDIGTMARLVDACDEIRAVNLGGIHHRADRTHRLRYIYLSPVEESLLQQLASKGVEITAQDVPSARPVQLDELLQAEGEPE